MLILSRNPEESIRIGSDIVLTMIGVKGSQVRLGIVAPKNITVDREEVHIRKQSNLIHSRPVQPTSPESSLTAMGGDPASASMFLVKSTGTPVAQELP